MKISELVKLLLSVQSEFGDLQVTVEGGEVNDITVCDEELTETDEKEKATEVFLDCFG